ncbi:hypothetical protein RJ60_09295 [Mesotoga sp. B105.6.4]|nr:hypothetical protein RJ60_09295 [Mesotoga sp. B105.6.4]
MVKNTVLKEDYVDCVNSVIDYIEESLSAQVALSDLCAETFYSPVHLQRIFLHTVGETIRQYLKGRRLSEAADRLATTSMPILEIALQFGYDSQESFTRAFRSKYFITPGKYRRLGLHFAVTQKKRLHRRDILSLEGGIRMEPKIVYKEAFKVVGLKYWGNDPANNCPKFWRDFMERYSEIENVMPSQEHYGIMCTGEENFVDGKFD